MTSTDQLFERLNGHDLRDAIGSHSNAQRSVVITKPSHMPRLGWLRRAGEGGGLLLAGASVLLAGLAVTMGAVSWHAQYAFVLAEKHQHTASALEALGLDAGAVIFSVLGIALARLGRRAVIERSLVVLCALGSAGMNLLGADLGSPRSIAVYVMPPLLFAASSDRFVAVIRRAALGADEDDEGQRSSWRTAGRAAMYGLRFVLAPPSTATGVRRMLLNATPLPALDAPAARPAIEATPEEPPGPGRHREPRAGTKTQEFLRLVTERHGELAAVALEHVARIAAELAPEAALNEGSARRELRSAVLAAQDGSAA
jgi:hypothetical protein